MTGYNCKQKLNKLFRILTVKNINLFVIQWKIYKIIEIITKKYQITLINKKIWNKKNNFLIIIFTKISQLINMKMIYKFAN